MLGILHLRENRLHLNDCLFIIIMKEEFKKRGFGLQCLYRQPMILLQNNHKEYPLSYSCWASHHRQPVWQRRVHTTGFTHFCVVGCFWDFIYEVVLFAPHLSAAGMEVKGSIMTLCNAKM